MDTKCTHLWQYQGMVFSKGSQRPGSGACDRIYEEKYFCCHCLESRYANKRMHGNDYESPVAGSFPK